VGILFISHSSRDNEAAIKVRNWLKENGWGEVFLDLDPEHGLAAGHRWQQELKQAGERCSGVVVLISPDWLGSRWCQTEFLVADQLGKKIFPIFIRPTSFDELPLEIKAKFQIVDISEPGRETEGFERLAIGLKRAGLDPKSFEWPPSGDPHRSIYRGLQSLDEEDAAIFFGREGLITEGLDTLRRMRAGLPKRMLVIQGASGAGKSSFLKAGLIARLRRDEENFLVLPVVRPERAALSGANGLAAALGCDASGLNDARGVADALERLRRPVVERLKRFAESADETYAAQPPTIVIPFDQAEELFAAENTEAPHALELLAAAIGADANTVIVATIRTDMFSRIQEDPRLVDVQRVPFDLSPMPHGVFKEVIEGPARLANPPLTIEPALTEQLLKDLAADDALPLLAFTLERLLARSRGKRVLTLADYTRELGGLQGAITAAVDEAFAKAQRDPALPGDRVELQKLARAAFIPALVQIDSADAEPKRRVEQMAALPEATRPLVRHMIDERLLVSDRRTINGVERDVVEVAHEAILRQWPALKAWIAEERDALRALDGVRAAAAEWKTHASDGLGQSWLAHRGGRLEEAESLMARPDFANAIGGGLQAYLAACRANENSERLRERLSLMRTRRLQRRIWILVGVAASLVLLAGIGTVQLLAGIAVGAADSLISQAAKESEAGNYDQAMRYAIAGLNRASWVPGFRGRSGAEAEIRGAAKTTSALAVLRGHGNSVLSASFSHDGRRIVTASRDKTARIWDARSGTLLVVLRGHTDQVGGATFNADGTRVVTASDDGTSRIWDARSGAQVRIISGHEDAVSSAAFSPDGQRIVTGSADKTARIWNAHTGAPLAVLRGHEGVVESAAFSRDGKRVVTASDDKTAAIWDAVTGKELAILRGHDDSVNAAVFSPDRRYVATASDDKTVRIWDAETKQELAILHGHVNGINSVAYNFDGTRLVTASRDKTARMWDALTGHEISSPYGHRAEVNGAAFSDDGNRIVTAADDGTARVWDADIANHVTVLRGHANMVNSARFSPNGKHVATASNDNTARIWDVNSARQVVELKGHDNIVETAEFSPDGARLLTGSDDKTARIWDAATGRELAVLRGHKGRVYGASFSANGDRIVTASTDRTAIVWDAHTMRVLARLNGHLRGLTSASFSPDGQRIVTTSADGSTRIWDAASGACLTVLRGHRSSVSSADFSPDGTRIVTAGRDNTAIVWDARSGRQLLILNGHEDWVQSAAFSHDGNRIVTASKDRTARIWDARTGSEIAILRGHQGQFESASFSLDGTHIVTASDDNTARVWNIAGIKFTTGSELIQSTCKSLARGLSRFSAAELAAAQVLDPRLDADACRPASPWARFGRIFWVGISQ
jgi:WD40 repeat protein